MSADHISGVAALYHFTVLDFTPFMGAPQIDEERRSYLLGRLRRLIGNYGSAFFAPIGDCNLLVLVSPAILDFAVGTRCDGPFLCWSLQRQSSAPRSLSGTENSAPISGCSPLLRIPAGAASLCCAAAALGADEQMAQ